MEPSPQSVRQYMWKIWLWCGMITMRYDVTQLGVFCHMFFLGQGGTNKHAYWMQQSSLTHVAHLLKLQYIHNSSQTSCLIDQFCWIWLPKRTRNGPFQSIFHQIIVKSYPFLRPNSQPAGDTMSLCLCYYSFMVQQVSYLYENLLTK